MEEEKSFAEELAAHVMDYAVNMKTVRAFTEKEGCTMDHALAGYLQEEIEKMIDARLDPERWLQFAELPEEYKANENLIDSVYSIAADGWKRGYIAGFKDRANLG